MLLKQNEKCVQMGRLPRRPLGVLLTACAPSPLQSPNWLSFKTPNTYGHIYHLHVKCTWCVTE
jgi:hypothetical protein